MEADLKIDMPCQSVLFRKQNYRTSTPRFVLENGQLHVLHSSTTTSPFSYPGKETFTPELKCSSGTIPVVAVSAVTDVGSVQSKWPKPREGRTVLIQSLEQKQTQVNQRKQRVWILLLTKFLV